MSDISVAEMLQGGDKPRKAIQLSLLRLAAAQLDQAHQRGLVHGNLTPHSIIVSQNTSGEPVAITIKDFGTRFNLDPSVKTGRIPDDAYYLSPEQILGIDLTAPSDEFSFAVIAYEIVSGRRPFNSGSVSGLIFTICTDEPVSVHEIDPTLSPGVSKVLSTALAKDREHRFASCGKFAAALENELIQCEGWAETITQKAIRTEEAAMVGRQFAPRNQRSDFRTPPAEAPASRAAFAGAGFAASSATQAFRAPHPVETPPVYVPNEAAPIASEPAPATPFPAPYPATPFSGASLNNSRLDPAFESTPASDPEYPPLRRRTRYDDDVLAPRESPFRRIGLIAAILLLIGGAAFYFLKRPSNPDVPTQVLDTHNGTVSPPPASSGDTQGTPGDTGAAPKTALQQQPAPSSSSQPPATSQNASPAPVKSASAAAKQAIAPPSSPTPNQPTNQSSEQAAAALTAPAERQTGAAAVELLSEPPGASITVDNNPRLTCRAPCTVSVAEGRHTLAAQLAGYTVAQRIFNVPETTSVFVAMPRLSGALVVTSSPAAATILVDGKDYGMTPATLHLPPGQHQITLMNGSQRHDEKVEVVADGIQATGYSFPR